LIGDIPDNDITQMKLENNPCNLCGSTRVRILGFRDAVCFKESKNRETEVRVVKCKDCGLIYANPMPIFSEEDTQRNYSIQYYVDSEAKEYSNAEYRYQGLSEYRSSHGSILDIGCGRGHFLKICAERGWDTYGIDVSLEAANFAREKFGLKVFVGELQDASLPSESFDVIVMNSVLEHLGKPVSFLTEFHRILKRDGLLVVAVPNEGSVYHKITNLYFKLKGRKWVSNLSPLYSPYRMHGFAPKTLNIILQKTGFRVLKLSTCQYGISGIQMYNPFLRLSVQVVRWFSRRFNSGEGLEAYATK
jgi:2-polyprenyl-3-methyl-5-hydroxy-6-metoxy-1,4-benzoquinol methylase